MPLQKDTRPLAEKTDEVLYELPTPSYDYPPEVMTVACGEIFQRRNLKPAKITQLETSLVAIRTQVLRIADKPLSWPSTSRLWSPKNLHSWELSEFRIQVGMAENAGYPFYRIKDKKE